MKKNILKNQIVRVPHDLTSDPEKKQGWTGVVVSSDYRRNLIQVGFEDGTLGYYQFNALEILHTPKTLQSNLNASIKELTHDEISKVRRIIKHVSLKEYKLAYSLTLQSDRIKEICITDTESYYNISMNTGKHLGL